ncbi:uncharacterized protein LOC115662407 isoform X1 [Syzygium oleosum]|uniref:uncharacterized protein LOC115662407 isoform X1 n=1 Tax=Syzygium oleosum TaxID=219896 RepID=UPI0011D2A7B2|nr:uncharacterized protein LOC115662407 isoform X1 [Syzygium oleosum]
MHSPPSSSSRKKLKPTEKRDDDGDADEEEEEDEEESILVALIEHRYKEVDHLRHRVAYYTSQLQLAEKRLNGSKGKLALLRSKHSAASSEAGLPTTNGTANVKTERRSTSPVGTSEDPFLHSLPPKPKLFISAPIPQDSQPPHHPYFSGSGSKPSAGYSAPPTSSILHQSPSARTVKEEKPRGRPSLRDSEAIQDRGTKRNFEHKEHRELIPLIRSASSPFTIRCQTSSQVPSQHKRKLRSLALSPAQELLFATSALDGVVNLWQIQANGHSASLLSTSDCASLRERRWPEDVAWHPQGNRLFCAYTADGGDSQISILNLNRTKERARVSFMEAKPHQKGVINSIRFMPWVDNCFVTGGCDHAVILWNEDGDDDDNKWKPKALHRNLHSSAVMGVAGMQQKQVVLSAGADKKIIGFDVQTGRLQFRHQIESKCMSVLPNPCDFNLFMVQTGAPGTQLRLFDVRLRQTELHAFGWKQESSETQSALINQAWSPDGFLITSGSADPIIHVFDIRYNGCRPSQSIKAHQKRVFTAVWHHYLPLLISISSDLNIGIHKITS